MQVEFIEIRDHLSRFPPFDTLDEDVLNEIAPRIEISYVRADTDILHFGEESYFLYYVRSGAVEIYRRNGDLYNRLTEGDIFGHFGLLRDKKVRFPARAIEDSLLYLIPEEVFRQLCDEHDSFADFVEAEGQSRLKAAVETQAKASELMKIKVRKLVTRTPVTAPSSVTIREAAALMTEQSVSSLVIIDPDPAAADSQTASAAQHAMVGIITDRDFRTRMVAEGLAADTPISAVMTEHPITMQADDSVFEAMLCMLRNNIHHLPVVHRRRPIGVINLSDIIKYESQSSLYLVNSIFNKQSIKDLTKLLPDVRATFVRMVNEDASAHMIGSAMSSIGRNFTQRLLELAEAQLGPPPVPYCFMALGSMARDEQLIVSDQDNALILDDRFIADQHDAYFLELATLVSDGLAACGYTYCKGGIMATNAKWRQPLRVWKDYFSNWIERPNPQTLLNSSIFFDLDAVHGEAEMVEALKDLLTEKASRNEPFLAAMARNALNRTPPLGFFRTFVMEKDGEQKNVINLKRRGTAPLTDLIRVHALACGSKAQNSFERLDAIAMTKLMPPEAITRLRYALEFLSMVRIRHQAMDIEQDREPDNNVEPEMVTTAERHNLKEAFQILSNAQKFLLPLSQPAIDTYAMNIRLRPSDQAEGRPDWRSLFASLASSARNPLLAQYYQAGAVAAETPLNEVPLMAFDMETTGLDPKKHGIVSFGLVPMDLSRIRCQGSLYRIIKPSRELSSESVAFHRITHSDIEDAPRLTHVLGELLEAMAGRVMVVHYRNIERAFLDQALRHYLGEGIHFPVIDTMELEALIHPRQKTGLLNWLLRRPPKSIRLADSRQRYGLPQYQSHHALTDALATAELLQAQVATHFRPDIPVGELWR